MVSAPASSYFLTSQSNGVCPQSAQSLYIHRKHVGLKDLYGEAPQAVRAAKSYFQKHIKVVSDELSSDSPFLDVAGEIISDWALPFGVLLLTFSLFGVLYLVGKGRRADVKNRIAEQSSLISVLNEEDN